MGIMNRINQVMHSGSACPTAGSLGECCGIWLEASNATHAHYYAAVYLWSAAEGMPFAEVARWFKEAAGISEADVRVNLIVHDPDNQISEGRCHDGVRALGVTFTVPLGQAEAMGMDLPSEPPGPEPSTRLSAAELMGARAVAPNLTPQQIEEIAKLPVDQLQVRLISALAGSQETAGPAPAYPRCKASAGGLVILVNPASLRSAAENHPTFWDGHSGPDVPTVKITDAIVFAQEVSNYVNGEAEDGSTLLTRMLDAAIEEAVEQGCEGVNHG